jgi:hypothetical protein
VLAEGGAHGVEKVGVHDLNLSTSTVTTASVHLPVNLARSVSVDAPIRWGILATGGIAAKFTEDLARLPDAEVAAVGSRSLGAAEAFAVTHGIPRAYGTWQELAADPEVDVVYVATPHSAHHAATTICLNAGKAVLCEKPFTSTWRRPRTSSAWPARAACS